ncbi:LD-carboxypeptidase [Paenalcaligenes niemegkensis]|uniref:LD-carboxypeptidase n=1 Tax=Paenalcaligenes niemegkensis TaxID=2895469 RepID=UPI001EE7AEC1|nr:LD-carboxypeptidase [Paenalcaligenes niemegkensis]MCQ9616236.1 LD-carboxypeptidase [Paenalcaligenes niemegkensis]
MSHHHTDDCPVCHSHKHNDGIYIISPSNAVSDEASLDRAQSYLSQLGFSTVVDQDALARYERFAGSDEQRLKAFDRALAGEQSIVLASRGGYGLSRLLPYLNWSAIADSGKRFVGHSDFTAFNLALLAKTGSISYAGPCAAFDFGAEKVDELTADLFAETMRHELEVLSFESPDSDPVDARGILWGGNLAMVCSLLGTPYFPDIQGGVLFLEDVGEHPYRIERMLSQLHYAGVLDQQHAVLLGNFSGYKLGAHDNGYTLESAVEWLKSNTKAAVIRGLPYGHTEIKATLPIGKQVGIAWEDDMAYLLIDEHHHD